MSLRTIAAAALTVIALTGCDPMGDDVIGPEGGVVASEDGRLTLDIPEGALLDTVRVTIEEADDLPEGALGPAYRVEPRGTVFTAPVHVFYDYGGTGMELGPDDIDLVAQNTDHWSRLADRHVDTQGEIISASALYLSTFCVVER